MGDLIVQHQIQYVQAQNNQNNEMYCVRSTAFRYSVVRFLVTFQEDLRNLYFQQILVIYVWEVGAGVSRFIWSTKPSEPSKCYISDDSHTF